MHKLADTLRARVAETQQRWQTLDEDLAGRPLKPGGWSRKQVIGHLIDSASNNHQRFVRLLSHESVFLPSYAQDEWVNVQAYQDRTWPELLSLWSALNLHLAHVIWHTPPETLRHTCQVGEQESVTLQY